MVKVNHKPPLPLHICNAMHLYPNTTARLVYVGAFQAWLGSLSLLKQAERSCRHVRTYGSTGQASHVISSTRTEYSRKMRREEREGHGDGEIERGIPAHLPCNLRIDSERYTAVLCKIRTCGVTFHSHNNSGGTDLDFPILHIGASAATRRESRWLFLLCSALLCYVCLGAHA